MAPGALPVSSAPGPGPGLQSEAGQTRVTCHPPAGEKAFSSWRVLSNLRHLTTASTRQVGGTKSSDLVTGLLAQAACPPLAGLASGSRSASLSIEQWELGIKGPSWLKKHEDPRAPMPSARPSPPQAALPLRQTTGPSSSQTPSSHPVLHPTPPTGVGGGGPHRPTPLAVSHIDLVTDSPTCI